MNKTRGAEIRINYGVEKEQPSSGSVMQDWRYQLVWMLLSAALGTLVWRVIDLHVVNHEFLRNQGEMRTVRIEQIGAVRGRILDRHGEPLAVSAPVETLWANPSEVDLQDRNWHQVAASLQIKLSRLRNKLEPQGRREFVYIQRQVTPALSQELMSLDLQGLYSRREYKRYYPAAEVASHLVGFTNIDDQGQEGIELVFDEWLKGEPGKKKVLKDRRGYVVKDLNLLKGSQSGKDVKLSIDLRLQYLAYRELKAAVQAHGAKSGSVVILDVRNGETLAMANQPSFNPNNRSDFRPRDMRNRAITDAFEPGSTVKPFTMAAALLSGKFKLDSKVKTHPGFLRLNGSTIRDTRNYGELDLVKVVTKSSNVGTSRVALETGGEAVWEMFYRAGFGRATGIEYPGEGIGGLPNYSTWKPIRLATLSYGYGLSSSPLQLAQAYMAIAAGGARHPVSLIRSAQETMSDVQVMPKWVATQLRNILQKAVKKGGTGTRALIGEYSVAGKTGTVHRVGVGGYQEDDYSAVFAGFAPAVNPRLVMVVVIHGPQGNEYYGGEVAAPVFSRVMGSALRLLNVAPDILSTNVAATNAKVSAEYRNGGPR